MGRAPVARGWLCEGRVIRGLLLTEPCVDERSSVDTDKEINE